MNSEYGREKQQRREEGKMGGEGTRREKGETEGEKREKGREEEGRREQRRRGKEGRKEERKRRGRRAETYQVSLCFLFLIPLQSSLSSKHPQCLGTGAQ